MFDYLLLIVGLAMLLVGGDWLVRGAVGLAEKYKVPLLLISLTIVSIGTSAPELFVSVNSALSGADGIAIGNIVGSNIANVLLVLGLPALFFTIRSDEAGIGRNILVMIGITVLFIGMMQKGSLQRYDGMILLFVFALFMIDQYRRAMNARDESADRLDYHNEIKSIPTSTRNIVVALGVGALFLPFGAELTVNSAIIIAKSWNIPHEIIGLTIIAIGTSLPEIATTLMALKRGSSTVAMGNIVGSNFMNIAAIIGVTALVKPLSVTSHIFSFDVWVMLAASILLGTIAYMKITISKPMGFAMVLCYSAFIIYAYAY